MSATPDTAMILAAGLGLRMRPITDRLPKPLVPVGGKPMIDYAFDRLEAANMRRIVVNVHHLSDQLRDHLDARSGIRPIISDETGRLMDSGGGVVKALPHLGTAPFIILNADTFWMEPAEGETSNLERLARAWDAERMDMLLMTTAPGQMVGYDGRGDFLADASGRLRRHDGTAPHPVIYPGVAIVDPAILADAPREPFSLNLCFDRAIARGRLFGVPAGGLWLTVGTPQAIGEAEAAMADYASGGMAEIVP